MPHSNSSKDKKKKHRKFPASTSTGAVDKNQDDRKLTTRSVKTTTYLSEKSEFFRALNMYEEYYGESPRYIGLGTWTPKSSTDGSEETYKSLSYIESAFMISVFEDAIDELIILKYVIKAPVKSTWDFHYKTYEERFTRKLTPERMFPEEDGTPVFTSAIKLQRDRDHIEGVFQKTLKTLMDDGSFTPLAWAVEEIKREKEDDLMLIQELKENLIHLKDLKTKVYEKRRLDDLEEKERDELLYNLQDELDDIKLKCFVEERFVDKWENVRTSQNQWRLRNAENFYKNNLTKLSIERKVEDRVTHELQAYLKQEQTDLEEQLEQWMTKYDSEMERRENKIVHLKYDADQAVEEKNHLLRIYDDRKQEMKEWIEFREFRKTRAKASLLIQSWWRGIMVRKRLGPYKPKKFRQKKKK